MFKNAFAGIVARAHVNAYHAEWRASQPRLAFRNGTWDAAVGENTDVFLHTPQCAHVLAYHRAKEAACWVKTDESIEDQLNQLFCEGSIPVSPHDWDCHDKWEEMRLCQSGMTTDELGVGFADAEFEDRKRAR